MNPYEILGVSKDSTELEIRKQFLKKCREFHPDKNSSDQDGVEFIKIKSAYDKITGKDLILDEDVVDWGSLWKLSMDDILKFEKEYRGLNSLFCTAGSEFFVLMMNVHIETF